MAYSNYAQAIYDKLKALILSEFSNRVLVSNKLVVTSNEYQKFRKGVVFWLVEDNLVEAGQPAFETRQYVFEGLGVVNYPEEEQEKIWDFGERIKYVCETNRHVSTNEWYRVDVNLEYLRENEIEPESQNLKQVNLRIEVFAGYGTD